MIFGAFTAIESDLAVDSFGFSTGRFASGLTQNTNPTLMTKRGSFGNAATTRTRGRS